MAFPLTEKGGRGGGGREDPEMRAVIVKKCIYILIRSRITAAGSGKNKEVEGGENDKEEGRKRRRREREGPPSPAPPLSGVKWTEVRVFDPHSPLQEPLLRLLAQY